MMLPEMTSSARVARAFQRFARGAVVGLALGVLAACGGGGGGSSTPTTPEMTPTTPEMTITPVALMPVPMEQLEAATAINAGETVEGTLESADDVKYYRLDLAETSLVELTIDAEAGIEVALLDSSGIVLADATTASKATLEEIGHAAGRLYARVRNSPGGKALQAVNRKFAIVARVTKYVAGARTVINLLQGRPKGEIPLPIEGLTGGAASASVSFNLTEVFRRSDGGPVTYSFGASGSLVALGSVTFRVEREVIRATPGSEARPGPLVVSVCAAPADTSNIPKACVPWRFTLTSGDPLPRRKPGVPEVSPVHFIEAGGTFTSEPVGSYFEYAEGATVRFTRQERSSVGEGWGHNLVDGRLRVSSTSGMVVGNNIVVRLTIVDSTDSEDTRTAWVDFHVGIEPEEEEEEPGGVGVPVAPGGGGGGAVYGCMTAPTAGVRLCSAALFKVTPSSGTTPVPVCSEGETLLSSSCPTTGPGVVYECGGVFTYVPASPGVNFVIDGARRGCNDLGEEFTIHKQP